MSNGSATRRKFLKRGATLVAAGSVGTLAYGFFNPRPSASASIRFPDTECGQGGMQRYLVTYASEFGTTGEVAESIAATLCGRGAYVTTKRVGDVRSLAEYDAVVVGGPIHFDNWMSEAKQFVEDNETALAEIPVAYFFTCLTLADRSSTAEGKALGYAHKLEGLSSAVTPIVVEGFAGVLDHDRLSLPTLLASKIVYALAGVAEGDYRNWDKIDAWAQTLFTSG